VGKGSVSLTGDEVNVDLAVIDSVLLVGRVVPWHREGCCAESVVWVSERIWCEKKSRSTIKVNYSIAWRWVW
jgi:hypothetical protein